MKTELSETVIWIIMGGVACFAVVMSVFSIIYRKKHTPIPKLATPTPTPRDINVSCPKCGQRYLVDASMDGELVPCQKCGYEFVIHDTTPRPTRNTAVPPPVQNTPPNCARCHVCGGIVAFSADRCPHCGNKRQPSGGISGVGVLEVVFVVIGFPILAGFVMVLFVPPLFYGLAILAIFIIWIILIVSRCKSR